MLIVFFLVYTAVWLAVSIGSWYVARLLVGRALLPISVRELLTAWLGCVVFGFLPVLWIMFRANSDPYLAYYVLLGGTYFGALCGEICWLCWEK